MARYVEQPHQLTFGPHAALCKLFWSNLFFEPGILCSRVKTDKTNEAAVEEAQ